MVGASVSDRSLQGQGYKKESGAFFPVSQKLGESAQPYLN